MTMRRSAKERRLATGLVPVARASDSPIKLIGVGEGVDDLQPFDARAFSRSLYTPLPHELPPFVSCIDFAL